MPYERNNQETRKQVTTRGNRTSNPNAEKATAFEWDYQDEMVKIIITPELEESKQSERRRYDYDNSWVTCISRAKCLDLYLQVEKTLLPVLDTEEDKFVSVSVAEVNQVGLGIKHIDGKTITYFKLIRNIDPTNLQSQLEIIYEFRKGEVIVDYNNQTGTFANRIVSEVEFLLFVNDLREFVYAASKAYNHANRVVDRTYKDIISDNIRAIGTKVGADIYIPGAAQRAGAHYGQTSLFDNNQPSAPSEQINSLEDLELPFN